MAIQRVRPEIGQWYLHTCNGEQFCVVGLDEPSHMIETQSHGGDLDEIDAETWNTLPLARCPDPEDGSGPLDDVETCGWTGPAGRSLNGLDVLAGATIGAAWR